jgi:hypothetical protein
VGFCGIFWYFVHPRVFSNISAPKKKKYEINSRVSNARSGLAIVVMRQLPRRSFFENALQFKDIIREFEAFLKISILFEDIFREI